MSTLRVSDTCPKAHGQWKIRMGAEIGSIPHSLISYHHPNRFTDCINYSFSCEKSSKSVPCIQVWTKYLYYHIVNNGYPGYPLESGYPASTVKARSLSCYEAAEEFPNRFLLPLPHPPPPSPPRQRCRVLPASPPRSGCCRLPSCYCR